MRRHEVQFPSECGFWQVQVLKVSEHWMIRRGSKGFSSARWAGLAVALLAGGPSACALSWPEALSQPPQPAATEAPTSAGSDVAVGPTLPPVGLVNRAAVSPPPFVGRPGVPIDGFQVVLAMTLRAKGFPSRSIEQTTGVVGAERLAPPADLELSRFRSRGVRFSRYEPLDGSPAARSIAGLVDLEDDAGRRLSLRFEADYRADPRGLVLERTVWTPVSSKAPEIDLFIVPAAPLQTLAAEDEDDYRRLRANLARHAVDLRKPATWPAGRREYLIVVLTRDRIAPEARLVMGVSREPAGIPRETRRVRRYRYDGWPVAVLPGVFDLAGAPFWVQVKLAQSSGLAEVDDRDGRLIGLFAMTPER